MQKKLERVRCCLVVLDGWGVNERKDEHIVDGIEEASPTCMHRLGNEYLSSLLYAHGTYVGLASDKMMGNSEVGHLTIGAGRRVLQDSVRIRKAFEEKDKAILDTIMEKVENINSTKSKYIHILGILSDGNIHGHWKDILDLAYLLTDKKYIVYVHTISDGRDTYPSVYLEYLKSISENLPSNSYIASVSGRYYAMDRDKRMDRTNLTYNTLTNASNGAKIQAENTSISQKKNIELIEEHVKKMYNKNITDEFLLPYCISGYEIKEKDPVIISNFRVDRVKQIYSKISEYAKIITMTRVFSEQAGNTVLFERPEIEETLGDIIEKAGLSQARIAETEKLAHVTFFFDGGKEKKRQKEDRVIVPSPKAPTYDLVPEMSAAEVTNKIISQIELKTDFILANYANCDMVGHTGNLEATKRAVSFLDHEIDKLSAATLKNDYLLVITADHGNAEIMQNEHGPVKSHSTNRVPCIFVSSDTLLSSKIWEINKKEDKKYTLANIAPTILSLMNISVPDCMNNTSIISLFSKPDQ